MKVMLPSADVLADLTDAARDGGTDRCRPDQGLVKDSKRSPTARARRARSNPERPPHEAGAAASQAPVAVRQPVLKPAPIDDSGFQPIPFSFDDFDAEPRSGHRYPDL